MVNGVNWDYFPIGQNYAYSLGTLPDAVVRTAFVFHALSEPTRSRLTPGTAPPPSAAPTRAP